MSNHFSQQQLKDWFDGKLSDDLALELESHLESCDQCAKQINNLDTGHDGFQSRVRDILKIDSDHPSASHSPAKYRTQRPGDVVGSYKLVQLIGEGGMGTVWKAEQKEPVRRVVALKIIKAGMDTAEVIARFESERQALALMDHPNIARVLDAGATESGRSFFVMELVKGIPITDYCDEHRLNTQRRLELFCSVCRGIQHAHRKGIMHRDIKPNNVLVYNADQGPVAKIIDFGLAKATGFRLTEKTMFTSLGQMVGTPAYMSPEQAGLTGLDVDTRTDVYSLGVLLYELLTGVTPLDLARLPDVGLAGIQKVIREHDPPAPSTRLSSLEQDSSITARKRDSDPRTLSHLLRGDLDVIVMKALEKDRNRRYETPNELAEDIQRYLRHEPILARPASATYKFKRLYERNKVTFIAAALIFTSVFAGFVVSTYLAVVAIRAQAKTANALEEFKVERDRAIAAEDLAEERLEQVLGEKQKTQAALEESKAAQIQAEKAQSTAELEQVKAEAARAESEEVSRLLMGIFRLSDERLNGRTITVAELLDRTVENLKASMTDQPERRVRLKAAIAKTYSSLGLYNQAIPLLEEVDAYYNGLAGLESEKTRDAKMSLANAYVSASKNSLALPINKALFDYYSEHRPNSRELINAMNNLANSKKYIPARRKMREDALALAKKINPPEDPQTNMLMENLSISFWESGDQEEAMKLREEVLKFRQEHFGFDDPRTLFTTRGLLLYYQRYRMFDKSLPLAKANLDSSREVFGPDHPFTLTAMGRLASSLEGTGKIQQSLAIRELSVEKKRVKFGATANQTIYGTQILIGRYGLHGFPDKAMKLANTILEEIANDPEVGQKQVLDTKNNASFWTTVIPCDDLKYARQSEIWAKEAVEGNPNSATYHNTMGIVHYRLGHWEKAKASLEKSLSLTKNEGDQSDRFFLAMIEFQLGNSGLAKQKLAEAEEELLRVVKGSLERYMTSVRAEAKKLILGQAADIDQQ